MAKHHLVVKLRQRVVDDASIPDWIAFIRDKSVVKERLDPDVDLLLGGFGLKVWVTKEFILAGAQWSADETREGLDRTYRLIFQEDYALPDDLVARVMRIPSVEDAHALTVGAAALPPRELSSQASLRPASALIYLPYAQLMTKGSPDIRIAVLDTGVNLSHQELQGKIAKGADFVDLDGLDTSSFVGDIAGFDDVPEDEVGHGTHVSGIVAAKGLQMDEGVAPACSLMSVRVLATMKSGGRLVGAGIVDNINMGIKWAVDNGADVINMSLGMKHDGGGLPHEDVIRYAMTKDVTVVAASGNDGSAARYYPGALPGVIAVGAVDDVGAVTSFTSYGANITVVAPGLNIYSSFAHNTYAFASGTSQASPFVCASVGLLKSYARERGARLTNGDIQQILKHSSDRVDGRLRNEHAGYGLLNLADAFKFLVHSLN